MKTKKKKLSLSFLSKYRNELYGFAILWIMIFHGYAILNIDYSFGRSVLKPIALLLNSGNVGCEIFFLLSGICLYFSFQKDNDYYSFIKKRLIKLYLTVWVIDGLFWIYKYLIIGHFDIFGFIPRIMLLQFFQNGDQTIWFISTILVFYLFYPYIYRFLFKKDDDKSPIIRALILMLIAYISIISFAETSPETYGLIEIGLTRLPTFILGCMLGKYVYENKKISKNWLILMIVLAILWISVLGLLELHNYYLRFFYLIGGISLTFIVSYIFMLLSEAKIGLKINNFFAFFGKISIELYVSHIIVIQIYKMTPFYKVGGVHIETYIVLLLIAILVAYLASKIINSIKGKLNKCLS